MCALTEHERTEALNDYCRCLLEIRYRLETAINTLIKLEDGNISNTYAPIDRELCYLQLRKSFELVMFGSLFVQRTTIPNFDKKMQKEYHAGRILSFVKKQNPKFYPVPCRLEQKSDKGGEIVWLEQSEEHPFLEERDFLDIYNRTLSPRMHANRDFGVSESEAMKSHREISDIAFKLLELLGAHTVTLSDGDIVYAILRENETDKPTAHHLRRL